MARGVVELEIKPLLQSLQSQKMDTKKEKRNQPVLELTSVVLRAPREVERRVEEKKGGDARTGTQVGRVHTMPART